MINVEHEAARLVAILTGPRRWRGRAEMLRLSLLPGELGRMGLESLQEGRVTDEAWAHTAEWYREVRRAVGAPANVRVIVDETTTEAPVYKGQSWHYETKGGRYIHHPSAYKKFGWSNMVYCCSTLHVTVGRGWRPGQATMAVAA